MDTDESEQTRPDGLFETDEAVEIYANRIEDPEFFPQEQTAIERYFDQTGASVLDIGCGVGRIASLLDDRGFDVTGIDASEPLVAKAESLFPDIEFRVADITDTDLPSETFDYAVFSFFGLDYVTPKCKRKKALREINRVLKPGGLFLYSSHNSLHPLVPRSTRDLLSCGYDLLDLHLRKVNRERFLSRYKVESVPLGDIEIYLSNPVHQWIQLRKCGFTPLDIIGEEDGLLRFFERQPHFVAKK